MLLSGLWKMAAMSGVVGIGLVAVYQAHKGMEKNIPIVADSDDGEVVTSQEKQGDDSSSDEHEAEASESWDDAKARQADRELAADLPSKKLSKGRSNFAPAADEDWSGGGVLQTALKNTTKRHPEADSETTKPLKRPAFNFREVEDEEAAADSGTLKVAQAKGIEQTRPTPLPDDLDALESEILLAKERAKVRSTAPKPPKPFVRQSRDDEPKKAELNDPFTEGSPPEAALPTVPKTAPLPPEEDSTSPVRADPFDEAARPAEASSVPETSTERRTELPDPAENEASDPFEDTPRNPLPLSSRTRPRELNRQVSDPVELLLDDLKVEKKNSRMNSDREPNNLRLPTEVPTFNESPPPVITTPEQIPSNLEEAPKPRRLPAAEPVVRASNENLIGDGTIPPGSPRGVQQPRITIEKVAPQQATLGEEVVYKVIVKNVGNVPAQQVVIEDQIPKGTRCTGTVPVAEQLPDSKTLTWKIGTLSPNEEKKILVRVIPMERGSFGSLARVHFAAEVAAEIAVAAPEMAFSVKAPRQVRMGDSFEMVFYLKNTGGAAATNVTVRDLVPEGLKHEAASDIECPIGKLSPNEAREIVLAVTAVRPGKAINKALLSADNGIRQELETVVEVVGEHLALTRIGNTRIYLDRPVQFTNSVKNEGQTEVKEVRVAEVIPAGMDFVEASPGGRFDPVERAIFWTVGPLPPGGVSEVKSKLIARTTGIRQAKITATGPSGCVAGVKSEVDVVGRPELQFETANQAGPVAVGDRLISKIQLNNRGSAAAKNVGLTIELPKELKLVEVRGSRYKIRDNQISFETLPSVAPKENVSFEIVMEAIAEADAKLIQTIYADHLVKPTRRDETVHITAEYR